MPVNQKVMANFKKKYGAKGEGYYYAWEKKQKGKKQVKKSSRALSSSVVRMD